MIKSSLQSGTCDKIVRNDFGRRSETTVGKARGPGRPESRVGHTLKGQLLVSFYLKAQIELRSGLFLYGPFLRTHAPTAYQTSCL
jgi:hypothetical protein